MLQPVLFILAFTLTSFIFYWFPGIDIAVSQMFYDGKDGFYLGENPIVLFMYRGVPVMCGIVVVIAGFLGLKKFIETKSFNPKVYNKLIYFTLVCVLGAGLIVHTGFKDNFNRARPKEVCEFGGDKSFTPAFVLANQCKKNCSFVSGHASAGFMFFGLAFLFKDKKRRRLFTLFGLTMGSVIGAGRVIQGAHYLSDVIFAGFIMYMVAYALAKILKPAS